MSGRIEEDSKGCTGLVLVFARAELERTCLAGIEVVDNQVEMHLLGQILPRPRGRRVGLDAMKGNAVSVIRPDLSSVA